MRMDDIDVCYMVRFSKHEMPVFTGNYPVSTRWVIFFAELNLIWMELKIFVVTNDLFCISGGFAHLCICDFAMNIIINVMHDIDSEVHTTPIVTLLYMQIKEKNKKSESIYDSNKKNISS